MQPFADKPLCERYMSPWCRYSGYGRMLEC